MLTPTQRTCLRIVEVFENAAADRYDLLVSIKGDTGGLSGGLLMASMASGNLGKMLRLYRNMGGTTITEEEVQQTERKDRSQNTDPVIRRMFKEASSEKIMHDAQDQFFYTQFVQPAESIWAARGWKEPLTLALVLDGLTHGHFHPLANKVPRSLSEHDWVTTYVAMRKRWLAEHPNPLLHRCVYRMEFFEQQLAASNWSLVLPIKVHGVTLQ